MIRRRRSGPRTGPKLPLPLAALPALLVAWAACGAEPESATPRPESATPRPGGTVVIAASADITGVNELVHANTRFNQDIIERLFLQLFEEQADFAEHPPTFAPQLAESHEFSADRLTLTAVLRDDAVWSDGAPVTAEDVRWTWQLQVDPEIAWRHAGSKEAITDVEVVDPRTVRFHFSRAYGSQLADVNQGVILPRHAWAELPRSEWRPNAAWFFDHLVTSGPFLLESWEPQQQIVLRRNPRYFQPGRPLLDRVVFRIIPEKGNQLRQLLAGEIDYVQQMPPAEAAAVADRDDTRLVRFFPRQFNFVAWNLANPLFADAETRRAMTLAIDRQELVDALWFGYARVASSPIISTTWAHARELEPWPYDPAAASRLLAARGWSDRDGDGVLERDGQSFTFTLMTNSDNRLRSDAAVMIQQQLSKVGVDARVRTLEFNTVVQRSLGHDFDALLSGWTIDTSLDLRYAFHSDSIEGWFNFGAYSSPEVDRLIELARRQTDPAELGRILVQVQEILHRDQPYTLLWEPQQLDAARAGVRGIQANALSSFYRLHEWWLDGAE